MATLPALGNVNARIPSAAWLGGRRLAFDGTTLGLALAVSEAGGGPEDVVFANYGGQTPHGAQRYVVTPSGGGDRTPGGIWVVSARRLPLPKAR